jgi:hypothetical protein
MVTSAWGLYVVFQYLWCTEVSLSASTISRLSGVRLDNSHS